MRPTAFVARVIVAGVFALAGVAKLRDRAGTADGIRDLGVPDRAAVLVAPALPQVELGAAALLLIPATARVGAVVASILLIAFSVAIVRTLRTGRRPACHCFGTGAARPIGTETLVRNAALFALTIAAAVS